MKNYISVNIVSEALIMIQAVHSHGYYKYSDIQHLCLPYGIRLDVALSFARQCEWLVDDETTFIFTETGKTINQLFDGETISKSLWRLILQNYITVCQPAWARRIPFGRREALLLMSEEEARCFSEADLIYSYDEETIKWWDSFAEKERMKRNANTDDTRRKGERLTIEYEERRTGRTPEWCSVESNLSGYDVLSYNSRENTTKLLIEVKTSTRSLEQAEAIISRHEWDVATMKNNIERYRFYFWLLDPVSDAHRLAVIQVNEMWAIMPEDRIPGHWETASIPFSAFSDRFETVV